MKIGDKVVFKYYKDIPNWKLDVFEIADIINNRYSIKTINCKTSNHSMYSKDLHNKEEFISLKEERKLKIQKLNEIS